MKMLIDCPCCGHAVTIEVHIPNPFSFSTAHPRDLATVENWEGCECSEWLVKFADAFDEYHDECLDAMEKEEGDDG